MIAPPYFPLSTSRGWDVPSLRRAADVRDWGTADRSRAAAAPFRNVGPLPSLAPETTGQNPRAYWSRFRYTVSDPHTVGEVPAQMRGSVEGTTLPESRADQWRHCQTISPT